MTDGDDQLPAELPPEPPKYADIELTTEQIAQALAEYPEVSERKAIHYKKLSILAHLRKHYRTPDGRALFGGPQPNSGRKATKRVGEAIVDAAQGRTKEIIDAAFAPLGPNSGATPMERHKAAMKIAEHERHERELDMAEDEFARKTEEEVRKDAAAVLVDMVVNGEISLEQLSSARHADAEAEAEEITDATEAA